MKREFDALESRSLASASRLQDGWLIFESTQDAYELACDSETVCAKWRDGFILSRDLYDLPEGAKVVGIRNRDGGWNPIIHDGKRRCCWITIEPMPEDEDVETGR